MLLSSESFNAGEEKRDAVEIKVAKNLWGLVLFVLSSFADGQEWKIKCYK